MIGYMSLEEQVEADFLRARRRAFFGRIAARFRGECDRLLGFDEVRKAHRAINQLCLGRRVVETSTIVGSVGRHRDFDRGFMPVKESLKRKWEQVDRAFHGGEELPPVPLWLGSQGPRMLAVTGRSSDGWISPRGVPNDSAQGEIPCRGTSSYSLLAAGEV